MSVACSICLQIFCSAHKEYITNKPFIDFEKNVMKACQFINKGWNRANS